MVTFGQKINQEKEISNKGIICVCVTVSTRKSTRSGGVETRKTVKFTRNLLDSLVRFAHSNLKKKINFISILVKNSKNNKTRSKTGKIIKVVE